ncbi:MAG: hypothetical protein AAF394_07555, partial [Planctomycetota bacterium]
CVGDQVFRGWHSDKIRRMSLGTLDLVAAKSRCQDGLFHALTTGEPLVPAALGGSLSGTDSLWLSA